MVRARKARNARKSGGSCHHRRARNVLSIVDWRIYKSPSAAVPLHGFDSKMSDYHVTTNPIEENKEDPAYTIPNT